MVPRFGGNVNINKPLAACNGTSTQYVIFSATNGRVPVLIILKAFIWFQLWKHGTRLCGIFVYIILSFVYEWCLVFDCSWIFGKKPKLRERKNIQNGAGDRRDGTNVYRPTTKLYVQRLGLGLLISLGRRETTTAHVWIDWEKQERGASQLQLLLRQVDESCRVALPTTSRVGDRLILSVSCYGRIKNFTRWGKTTVEISSEERRGC